MVKKSLLVVWSLIKGGTDMYCDGYLKFHSVSESSENLGLTLFFQVLLSVDLNGVLSSVVQVKRLDSSGRCNCVVGFV